MDKKAAYRVKMEAKIEEMSARIDAMKARAKGATGDARLDLAETVERLERQRTSARHKLDQLVDAGEDAWEDLKEEVEEVFGDLKEGFAKLRDRFNPPEDDA